MRRSDVDSIIDDQAPKETARRKHVLKSVISYQNNNVNRPADVSGATVTITRSVNNRTASTSRQLSHPVYTKSRYSYRSTTVQTLCRGMENTVTLTITNCTLNALEQTIIVRWANGVWRLKFADKGPLSLSVLSIGSADALIGRRELMLDFKMLPRDSASSLFNCFASEFK
uniref:SCP2 domain-containing protein n=1 Tax=Syphacia muris TaxID=451379 RepID=A0A0N5ADU2_9BILA